MAVTGVRITGLSKVLLKLDMKNAAMVRAAKAGMREAALDIQADAQEDTPHDTGNLKGSADTSRAKKERDGLRIKVFYTAAYAPFVHEINKNYKRGAWKFLEHALEKNRRAALRIIRAHLARMI